MSDTTPLNRVELDRLDELERAVTPAPEQSMLQDRWIEWRGADGQKYSIAEFEREADQELYLAMRLHLRAMLEEIRKCRVERE
jgi:phosphopantetheinyl transferase